MSGFSLDPSLYGDGTPKDSGADEQSQLPQPAVSMDFSPLTDQQAVPQQSDVDFLLRKKRKAREHKACYPCRQRKVKCDLSRPCQTCRDRDHPELCDYNPPNKRQSLDQYASQPEDGVFGGSGSITLGRAEFDTLTRKLNGLEHMISELGREVKKCAGSTAIDGSCRAEGDTPRQDDATRAHTHMELHGLHTVNQAGETVHFGAGSLPAMLWAFKEGVEGNQRALQGVLGKSILPLFGLDNESATYPFVDLWGLPHASLARAQELAKALPNDQQTLNLIRSYKSLSYVLYPAVADLDQFERDLTLFLVNRAAQTSSPEGVSENSIYGKSYYWLGLLFAVLASGAQSSTMPRKERELTSQVYMCCAMECARFTNFLSRPNMESIQTLLVIQNVLSNNMDAGTAWSLLGLTIRLAQSLGLHQPCPPRVSKDHSYPRSKIWWALCWQDSLLSIIYDRAGGQNLIGESTMPMPMGFGPVSPYHASMYRLIKVGHDIVRERGQALDMDGPSVNARITRHHNEVSTIMRNSAEYLKDSRKCETPQETLEHWGLYLHSSYCLSELCRPALSQNKSDQAHRSLCIENLINTVEAFLGLHDITAFARQSWAAVHRGLSSALLLGILGEHTHNVRAQQLLARFVAAMQDITTNIDPQEVSAPMQRGINALRKLNIPGVEMDGPGPVQDGTVVDANGSLTLAESTALPLHAGWQLDENSPHSILNTILWGASVNANPHSYPGPF